MTSQTHTADYADSPGMALVLADARGLTGDRYMIRTGHTYRIATDESGLLARCRRDGHDCGATVISIETVAGPGDGPGMIRDDYTTADFASDDPEASRLARAVRVAEQRTPKTLGLDPQTAADLDADPDALDDFLGAAS